MIFPSQNKKYNFKNLRGSLRGGFFAKKSYEQIPCRRPITNLGKNFPKFVIESHLYKANILDKIEIAVYNDYEKR